MTELPLTGERTAPGVWHENYWFQRHLTAYEMAAPLCAGRRVLDAGCGEGYGAALLASSAASVIGAELVAEVVTHAHRTYPELEFVQVELGALPLVDGCVDVVVSFQVIEHLWDVGAYLAEIARVLVPGGLFLCSTPNRLTFTPGSDSPINPFHVREFTAAELRAELGGNFHVESVVGLHHGPRLRAVEQREGRSVADLLLETEPEAWPAWLGALVREVTTADFVLGSPDRGGAAGVGGPGGEDDHVRASLDLVAVSRPAGQAPTPAG